MDNDSRMDKIRVFIAIQLPDYITVPLFDLTRQIRGPKTRRLKFVDRKKMHLTLKFIGDVESAGIGDISSVAGNQVKDEIPFSLQLGKPGVFPGSRNPKVLWLGIEGQTKHLKIIQKDIDLGLHRLGYPSDDQLYSPHVTVARLRGSIPSSEKYHILNVFRRASSYVSGLNFEVDSMSIMRSTFTGSTHEYTRLSQVPFGKCS